MKMLYCQATAGCNLPDGLSCIAIWDGVDWTLFPLEVTSGERCFQNSKANHFMPFVGEPGSERMVRVPRNKFNQWLAFFGMLR